MNGIACKKCAWFGTRVHERSVESRFVDPSIKTRNRPWDVSMKHGERDSRSIPTCQHPICFILIDYGREYNPLEGISYSYEVQRVNGHAILNAKCDCSLFQKRKWYHMADVSVDDRQLRNQIIRDIDFNRCVEYLGEFSLDAPNI